MSKMAEDTGSEPQQGGIAFDRARTARIVILTRALCKDIRRKWPSKKLALYMQALSKHELAGGGMSKSPSADRTTTFRAKLATGNEILADKSKDRRRSGQSGDVPNQWDECTKCISTTWMGSACRSSEFSDTRPSYFQACPLSTKAHSERFACRDFPLSKARLVLSSPRTVVPVLPPAKNATYGTLSAITRRGSELGWAKPLPPPRDLLLAAHRQAIPMLPSTLA